MTEETERTPIDAVYQLLNDISHNGNAKEKLFGFVVYSALQSLTEESEKKGAGINKYIDAISNISIENESLKQGYIDIDSLSLDNYGFANLMAMSQDVSEGKENSNHEYKSILKKHLDENQINDEKKQWIQNKINDLNESLQSEDLSEFDIKEEILKIINQANEIYGNDTLETKVKYFSNSDISLRSKIVSDLFSVFAIYKGKVDLGLKTNKENDELKDNYAMLTMIKMLFYAHKLGFTREIYQLFYDGRDIANNITRTADKIMKESGEDMYKFFYVDQDKAIRKMENDILNDPKIDQSLKNELDDLFNNNSNLN
jgi:hypothetical protein